MKPVRRGCFGDIEIDHAGFNDGDAIIGIEFDDFSEPVEGDDNAFGYRQGAAGKAGA